jgi:uncharacterized protein (TIGR00661 family)
MDAPRPPTIFFALSSEGMGHATRALPTIMGLQARGYHVEVFCGGRVAKFLRERLGNVVNDMFFIPLVYENSTLNMRRSTFNAFMQFPTFLRHALRVFWRMRKEKPVAVISDFEFISAWFGMFAGMRVILLDNMHVITHGALPEPTTAQDRADKKAVARAVWWNQPVFKRALITSFFQPGLKAGVSPQQVRFVPCAVRPEVTAMRDRIRTDGPVLVYQTSSTNVDLPPTLVGAAEQTGLRFVVYGMGERTPMTGVEFRGFSEQGFLTDLAQSPFVIVNGGHSTIVEALALQKPVLAEPIRRQYEQKANAVGLETLGVGRGVDKMSTAAVVEFARDVEHMRSRMPALAAVISTEGLVQAVVDTIQDIAPQHVLQPRQSALGT